MKYQVIYLKYPICLTCITKMLKKYEKSFLPNDQNGDLFSGTKYTNILDHLIVFISCTSPCTTNSKHYLTHPVQTPMTDIHLTERHILT